MISELRDSSPVFWSIGSVGKAPWSWLQRGHFNSRLVLERNDGRGLARRDRMRERLSAPTVRKAPWSWAALVEAEELWPRRVKRTAGTAPWSCVMLSGEKTAG